MTDATEATGRDSLGGTASPLLVGARLGIGLAQGAALWWLYQAAEPLMLQQSAEALMASHRSSPVEPPSATWPATVPELFGPLAMILFMVPFLLLAGASRMRARTLLLWVLGATAFLALLGWHGVASLGSGQYGPGRFPPFLPWPMPLFAATALFIGHNLVVPADRERKWIAAFPTYFDTAWKAGVQLALSIGFTGAFWLLLFLGSALFHVIGLDFLRDLLGKEWFSIPITTLVFATAVHLTDVRDGLIRGVRSVVLMLLSWLLLLMTVLAAGFLAALPFTGLDGLWETGNGTSLVLAAAAALIILINTAYQDGRPDNLPPLVLRVAVRVAAVLISPLIIIAVWGLSLRIDQYGLTPDRIIAAACALVGAAYAVGYGWAALSPFWRKGDWMRPLERTNIWTAILTVATILLLFSPALDPARLSVMDQVARLERGAVTPDKFDYRFLRFESGKAGQAALAQLVRSTNTDIARRAAAAASARRWDPPREEDPRYRKPVIAAFPATLVLPERFTSPDFPIRDNRWGCNDDEPCLATMLDVNGDGAADILLGRGYELFLFEPRAGGEWEQVGVYEVPSCKADALAAIRAGTLAPRPARRPDLAGDGWVQHFRDYDNTSCGPRGGAG